MPLNSAKLIAKWTARYSGTSLYFANSTAQSAAESGGRTPTTGFHSVIDKPERVSRVMPPTTTIRKIIAQHVKSHAATGESFASPLRAEATPEFAAEAPESNNARSSKTGISG